MTTAAKPSTSSTALRPLLTLFASCLLVVAAEAAAPAAAPATAPATATPAKPAAQAFATPQEAAEALVAAAEKFDTAALENILGPDGHDIVSTGEEVKDKQAATTFAALGREKMKVEIDPKSPSLATMVMGNEDWPSPVRLVKRSGKWSFDAKTGREEILLRRIGENELHTINVCRGYVEAQETYALEKHGTTVNQYAQRIIATPGKQDGLAWKNADGTWGGPVGQKIAEKIESGYTKKTEPLNGYFFKVLKGQGPAAALGEMDFVVKGAMIGGFALIATPAEYQVTGVMSFLVSHEGVVYQKDLGPKGLDEFTSMERYNPDKSWTITEDEP